MPIHIRLNRNSGATATGHPLGSSGARLILTHLCQFEFRGGRFRCIPMYIDFG
ncbi:hypothetical protein EOK75_00170 [Pseudorhodobacter turbinis]|uniref:Thiolase C-terminal domain-containing protein n=1 Tax=Pseudorhodobacter turbinis TaxID=2500533 RepID=A0A4P8EDF1_9RHOB|nr:hypothetical protein EOK75_00170 [Pseudorhodobacter turbinis]